MTSDSPNPLISRIKSLYKRYPALTLFALTWLLYAMYLVIIASPKYESESLLVLKNNNPSMGLDGASFFLGGFGGTSASNDTEIARAFMFSSDLLLQLDHERELASIFQHSDIDFFQRLESTPSNESLVEYYQDLVSVAVDSASSIITLKTRAFSPQVALEMNNSIIEKTETFVNQIGNQLAESRLEFAKNEHENVKNQFEMIKGKLLDFQKKHNIFDPSTESTAFLQITYSMESALAQKRAELAALRSSMTENAPDVTALKRQISALEQQIAKERARVNPGQAEQGSSVSELVAQHANLRVQLEIASQAFSASLLTLENARVDAYKQMLHLVTISRPTAPQDDAYPRIGYNLTLFAVLLCLVYGLGRIVIATVRELS